jgi:hypothetical protein
MKKLSIVLILIIVLILSSCASVGNDVIDGNAYDYYETYEVENNIYDIYLPQAPEDVIYYSYEVSKTKTDKSTWTINYIYSGKYHVDEERESQEIWISLYNTLASSKDKLEELCCFEIELYNPYDTFEREITLVNNTKNIISYVVVDIYLPIKIHNKSSNEYYIVGVPVNNKFLIKTDTHVQSPKTLEFILWEDFLAIPNMKKN